MTRIQMAIAIIPVMKYVKILRDDKTVYNTANSRPLAISPA